MEALVFVDITSSMYLQLGSEVIIYIRISECKKKCNIQDYERGERYPGMTNRNKMQREGVRESARERERVREIRDRQTDRHVLTCTRCNIQDYERGERYPGMTNRDKMQREGVRESARARERVREIRDRQTDRHVLTCTTSLCKSLTYPRP
jgi:hypothetical protein